MILGYLNVEAYLRAVGGLVTGYVVTAAKVPTLELLNREGLE